MVKCSSALKSFMGGWEWRRVGGVVVFLYRYTNRVGLVLGYINFIRSYTVRRPRRCYGHVLLTYINSCHGINQSFGNLIIYVYMCIYIHIIYIKVYNTNEYTILRAIIYNNTSIYILVNSVINHANYLQLQKHCIKYSTSHSYYHSSYHTTHIYINNFIYKKTK